MTWTLEVNLGALSFTVTPDNADHADTGGAVAGDAWLVESLRVGWRLGELPPAKPEPITISLSVACHPPTLLRDLDEGQPADVRFTLAGDTAGTHALYAAGRIGGPLTVTTAERDGVQWGFAALELVDYTVDLATLTLNVDEVIPVQTFTARADALNAELLADTGIGFLSYPLTGPASANQRFGVLAPGAGGATYPPGHAAIAVGAYPAATLLDTFLGSEALIARPDAARVAVQSGDYLDNGTAYGGLPFVVPVVDDTTSPGTLLGYVLTAAHKVSLTDYLPAEFGATPAGYGLVLSTSPDATRHLDAGEIETSGGWTRDRVSTRVTASHQGSPPPAVVTAYDPDAGDSRIVSRDLSTDIVDTGGFNDTAFWSTAVAWSRLPTPVFDRLGWRLGEFTWHPLASSPTEAADVLRWAIPDHSDTSAWTSSDALTMPWWITGVDPDLAFSAGRDDYAGTLDAADFVLAPGKLPADYALTFSLVRRIAQPLFKDPWPAILSADALTSAGLGAISAGDLDPDLTFSDLMLARSPV